ncbi:7488_t:CDS:2, partial [Scutellospora calospora]
MDDLIQSYLTIFCLGVGSMISLRNLGISIKYYFSRHYGKISDMFRIICNYTILWQFVLLFGYYAAPSQITLRGCQALGYIYLIGRTIFRISFAAYLLWRLRKIEKKQKDSIIGSGLLIIMTSFSILLFIFIIPQIFQETDSGTITIYYCDYEENEPTEILTWCSIIMDFTVYTYVTIRLIQILRHNSNQVESTTTSDNELSESYRVKMINWSLILSSLSFLMIWFEFLNDQSNGVTGGSILLFVLKTLLYTALSFIITIDDVRPPINEINE